MTVQILIGDVRDKLRELPDESVHCVVTSPPYWGLRCYGVDGQIGQEPTLGAHVDVIVEVFRGLRRVLRKDGTVWLNYGDCYAGSWGAEGHRESSTNDQRMSRNQIANHPKRASNTGTIRDAGLKPKDLCMMPARVALALQADGWWLRSEIIWHKPNPMPESVTDRPTSAHEKIYLLARSERYYFDAEAVRERWTCDRDDMRGKGVRTGEAYLQQGPVADNSKLRKSGNKRRVPGAERIDGASHVGRGFPWEDDGKGRNIRNVWTIATAPFPDAHFATFPPALIEPCIKAGTSEKGCCPECGAPWTRLVTTTRGPDRENRVQGREGDSLDDAHGEDGRSGNRHTTVSTTTGWQPACGCDLVAPVACTVLDCFAGAGTTGLVADRLKRNAILIELNPDYAEMAKARIQADGGMFAEVHAP